MSSWNWSQGVTEGGNIITLAHISHTRWARRICVWKKLKKKNEEDTKLDGPATCLTAGEVQGSSKSGKLNSKKKAQWSIAIFVAVVTKEWRAYASAAPQLQRTDRSCKWRDVTRSTVQSTPSLSSRFWLCVLHLPLPDNCDATGYTWRLGDVGIANSRWVTHCRWKVYERAALVATPGSLGLQDRVKTAAAWLQSSSRVFVCFDIDHLPSPRLSNENDGVMVCAAYAGPTWRSTHRTIKFSLTQKSWFSASELLELDRKIVLSWRL